MEYDENELAHMLAADLSHSFYYLVQRYQHLLYAFALSFVDGHWRFSFKIPFHHENRKDIPLYLDGKPIH